MRLHVSVPWLVASIGSVVLPVSAAYGEDVPSFTRAVPIPVPADAPREGQPGAPKAAKQGVIFVNFAGVNLSQGNDSSHNDVSQIFGGDFAPYGGNGTEQAATMEAVRNDWAAYNVLVVDSRPAGGDYTMNVTSPTNPLGGGVLGIAPLDCYDQQTHNNITFAFHGAGDGFPASVQATTIGQEVAHSYGLEHVDNPNDIMNPYNAGGDPSFTDNCLPIVQGGQCGQQHAAHCGSGTSQNSHQELLELFGPNMPDTQAPTVSITSPMGGDIFPVGASFTITASATDDAAVAAVELFNGEASLQSDASAPYEWEAVDIPEGVYEFKVIARDLTGNEAESEVVEIVVGDPPLPSDSSGDDGDDVDADDDDDGDDDGTDGGGTSSATGFPEDDADQGCGCRSPAGPPLATAWLGLAALARRRRRTTR